MPEQVSVYCARQGERKFRAASLTLQRAPTGTYVITCTRGGTSVCV